MFELQRLRPDHEAAVLAFERANRAYFAETINDRGDEFFATFPELFGAMLTEQEDGGGGAVVFEVLVDDGGRVAALLTRPGVGGGPAGVGYRVAGGVSGRGVA